MKENKLPVSHPQWWYARLSSSVMIVFLKKSVSSDILPSTILVAPRVGEEEVVIAVLSALKWCPELSVLADGATGAAGAWTVVSDMEQQRVKAMKDEKVRERNDRTQWVQ
jgi:hypothetical protein